MECWPRVEIRKREMGRQTRCRVLCVHFPLLPKEWMCRTSVSGSLEKVPFCVSPLIESSRIKVLRGTEASRDGKEAVILPRGSNKQGFAGVEAVYHSKGEPFHLFSLNALQFFVSIHHMSQQLIV